MFFFPFGLAGLGGGEWVRGYGTILNKVVVMSDYPQRVIGLELELRWWCGECGGLNGFVLFSVRDAIVCPMIM